jgi:hypothetical protein
MRSTQVGVRQYALKSVSIAAAFGLLLASCKQSTRSIDGAAMQDSSRYTQARRAPGLPKGCKANNPPATPAELQACLDSLDFNEIEALGDKQPMMVHPPCPETCRYGPLATIQPEEHSYLYSEDELKQGRIIARLFLDSTEKVEYRKLGLVPGGKTYWWVQKTSEDTSHAGRSVYITLAAGKLRLTEDTVNNPLRYSYHKDGFKQAVARFVWDPTDDKLQGNCGQGCCH